MPLIVDCVINLLEFYLVWFLNFYTEGSLGKI